MRCRHFSPELVAYERDFRQTMRYTSRQDDTYMFVNDVPFTKGLMSTQPRTSSWTRRGPDEFVGRSDTMSDDGKAGVVEVTYRRAK